MTDEINIFSVLIVCCDTDHVETNDTSSPSGQIKLNLSTDEVLGSSGSMFLSSIRIPELVFKIKIPLEPFSSPEFSKVNVTSAFSPAVGRLGLDCESNETE